jgi:polyisoprenoid-binding protein YceI
MLRQVPCIAAGLMLAACAAPPHPVPTSSTAAPPEAMAPAGAVAPPVVPAVPHDAQRFDIDPATSEIRVLVYRGGLLASLGHNHVIVNRALAGTVDLPDDIHAAHLVLQIPVSQFVVDEDAVRAEEGPAFAGARGEDVKSGTLRNMLGAALLDAAQFPGIRIDSSAIAGAEPQLLATLRVTVKGVVHELQVPFELQRRDGRLIGTGRVQLTHAQLGMKPYSVAAGALAVQEAFDIKFHFEARPAVTGGAI